MGGLLRYRALGQCAQCGLRSADGGDAMSPHKGFPNDALTDLTGEEREMLKAVIGERRLCCTNPVRDSSHESSVVAGMHEQTYTRNLQDQELASIQ